MNVKDRLTAHNKAGQGIINMDGVSDVLEASARIRTFSPLIISKLTEYEDTGLSPNEIERLKSENAALRERLEKAVELPCKIGDRFYIVEYYPPEIIEEECCDFSFIELSKILLDNGCGVTYELGDNGCFFVTLDKNEAIRIYNQKKEEQND